MECKNKHFRHILLFYFCKGKKAAEAHKEICEVYGVDCITDRTCQNWFKKFRSGDFSLKDDQRSGRPTEVDDNDVLRAEVEANPCQTIEDLSNTLNQPWSTIHEHLQEIRKVSRAGVWVPHNLSGENKANRSTTCNLLLQRYNTEAFFDHLIIEAEKWVLYDNKKFENLDDIQNALSRYFAQKPIDFYRSGIENLHTRWQKVVDNEADYIID
ncbi:Histone-lysine N-methyltransferase SETMAR [Dufourea novaeangliae]|uniref:Histone-lysine N-methyltransferase SETMAR n=1 Tax=Dufourea novaeangliae TaxID=178035 RepID=A0A154PQM4_DUFNO|nr:Histone-lysine N-methyltransferase SETMAR [Dufourea novaeangliae]